jgi:hypothetical protein
MKKQAEEDATKWDSIKNHYLHDLEESIETLKQEVESFKDKIR